MRLLLILAGTTPAVLFAAPALGGTEAAGGLQVWPEQVVVPHATADTVVRGVQLPASGGATVRFGLAELPLPWAIPPLPVPGALDPWLSPGGFARAAATVLATHGRRLFADERLMSLPNSMGDGAGEGPEVVSDIARRAREATNLGIRVVGRTELGGDWSRFRPCEARLRASCTPTLVPRLDPELRFGIRLGGIISDRIQVDVDYDQMREFDAANTINIRYLGGEDAIVRHLDIGDVTFQLPTSPLPYTGPAGREFRLPSAGPARTA